MMRATKSCRHLAVIGAVGVVAVLAAGEAAAQGQVPSAGTCTNYSMNPTSADVRAAGTGDATNTFTVSWTWTPPATPNCVVHCNPNICSRTSSPSWITDVTLRSGTVSYKVSKNPSEQERSGGHCGRVLGVQGDSARP